jgi:hypothetical protein
MGHITAAVAALFITSDRNMVTTRITPARATALPCATVSTRTRASRSAAPVVFHRARHRDQRASSTITGQSMAV